MNRSFPATVGIFALCAACSSSSSPTSGSSTGSGGTPTTTTTTTGTGGAGTTTTTTGTGGAGTTTTTTGTGGADAGSACSDPTNPALTSCIVGFLAGCWAPDLSGTCTSTGSVVSWSDGSKYVSQGAMPGLYAPGDTTPCIAMTLGTSSITATKGSQTLVYDFDETAMTATITCPDGSTFMMTSAQATAFNVCHGLNCP
jgi:hypothetical protein